MYFYLLHDDCKSNQVHLKGEHSPTFLLWEHIGCFWFSLFLLIHNCHVLFIYLYLLLRYSFVFCFFSHNTALSTWAVWRLRPQLIIYDDHTFRRADHLLNHFPLIECSRCSFLSLFQNFFEVLYVMYIFLFLFLFSN